MWLIDPAGDRAVLVRVWLTIDPLALGEVLALERALTSAAVPGLLGTVPSYASLLCRYDPVVTDSDSLAQSIRPYEGTLEPMPFSGDVIDIPTRYDGPDLDEVAEKTALSRGEVIELHAGRDYLVYCIGFAPGFTYCGELHQGLTVPRKASPRPRVRAGSVAIAGRQTGIYAVDSPGGWSLIGRTDVVLLDPDLYPPARFKPGDRIRFVPIRD